MSKIKSLNLDKNTLGRAPACLYLTMILDERGDQKLLRKTTRLLSGIRELLNDVSASHVQGDELNAASFGKILELIERDIRERSMMLADEFIGQLVINILIGELRMFKRRCQSTSILQRSINRSAVTGESVKQLKVMPRADEATEEERQQVLRVRSASYLARKGKQNTLYPLT